MTTLTCDLCSHEESAETFQEWMMKLMPHYMEAHADVMNDASKWEEDKQKRMVENKARFDAA